MTPRRKKPIQGVTLDAYQKKVDCFAKRSVAIWRELLKFVKTRCPNPSDREGFMGEMCQLIDKYIDFNAEMLMWCHANGEDPRDFVCEVSSQGFQNIEPLDEFYGEDKKPDSRKFRGKDRDRHGKRKHKAN